MIMHQIATETDGIVEQTEKNRRCDTESSENL